MSEVKEEEKKTHHGVYVFEREVTAWCLFRKDREKQKVSSVAALLCTTKAHYHVMSCCVISSHTMSKLH